MTPHFRVLIELRQITLIRKKSVDQHSWNLEKRIYRFRICSNQQFTLYFFLVYQNLILLYVFIRIKKWVTHFKFKLSLANSWLRIIECRFRLCVVRNPFESRSGHSLFIIKYHLILYHFAPLFCILLFFAHAVCPW